MKKLILVTLFILSLVLPTLGGVFDDHEYAPIEEKDIEYKNWTYKNVLTDKEISLREFSKDKKLVLVFYHAHWCHSSNYQAPVTQGFYEKYKDDGLAVIGVSMYGTLENTVNKVNWWKFSFPVVGESFTSKARKTSLHYKYRTATGDSRKWATPWNIFLDPGKFNDDGDILVNKAFVANGELVKDEAEAFIRKHLGLPELKDTGETEKKGN
jgi:thiol-disulfide isomerase/thioredoxin